MHQLQSQCEESCLGESCLGKSCLGESCLVESCLVESCLGESSLNNLNTTKKSGSASPSKKSFAYSNIWNVLFSLSWECPVWESFGWESPVS